MTRMAIIYKDMQETANKYNAYKKILGFVQEQISLGDENLCDTLMNEETRLIGYLDFHEDNLWAYQKFSGRQFTWHKNKDGFITIDTNGFDFIADEQQEHKTTMPKHISVALDIVCAE